MLSGIAEGVVFASNTKLFATRLFIHEASRVFADRLSSEADEAQFANLLNATLRVHFRDTMQTHVGPLPSLRMGSLAQLGVGRRYMELPDDNSIVAVLNGLAHSNRLATGQIDQTVYSAYTLKHLLRISRALSLPHTSILLLGSTGVGKGTLSRLACKLADCELISCSSVNNSQGAKVITFRDILKEALMRSGLKVCACLCVCLC